MILPLFCLRPSFCFALWWGGFLYFSAYPGFSLNCCTSYLDVGKSLRNFHLFVKCCWVRIFPVVVLATVRCISTASGEQYPLLCFNSFY